MSEPRLLVFASGTHIGGGSGFKNLVEAERKGALCAKIVGVVSNHFLGGVVRHARDLGVKFYYFPEPYTAKSYQRIVKDCGADFVALSGWLKLVEGLDPKTTFNIHPGPLPKFGGLGMHGYHVHEAVITAFREGQITHSAVSMHFVTEEYDKGPVFFHYEVPIFDNDTPETLGQRVNRDEHRFQPTITDMVLRRMISWDGANESSLKVPANYDFLPKEVKPAG